MIHPNTEVKYISPLKGYGVFAKVDIPAGTIMWVLDQLDKVMSPAEVFSMDKNYQELLHTYCFIDNKGNYVLCWDNERYINHSFNANVLTTAYDFTIAIRDIAKGEEVTNDYGTLNIQHDFDSFLNEGSSRHSVYKDDLVRYHELWDTFLNRAIQLLPTISQPLWKWVSSETQSTILQIVDEQLPMKSILSCHYYQNI